jgi:hypothetical protein
MVAPEPIAEPRTAPTSGLSNTRRHPSSFFEGSHHCQVDDLRNPEDNFLQRNGPRRVHQHNANLRLYPGRFQQLSDRRIHVQCKGISLLRAIQLYLENALVQIIENVFNITWS